MVDFHVASVLGRRLHLVAALGAAEPRHGVGVRVLRVVQRVLRLPLLALVTLEFAILHPNFEGHLGHRIDVRHVHLQVDEVLADEVKFLGAVSALRQGPPFVRLQRRVDDLQLARGDGGRGCGGGHLGRLHSGSCVHRWLLLLLLLDLIDICTCS